MILDVEAAAQDELVAAGLAEVVGDHLANQVAEPHGRRPTQALARLGGVADEAGDLGGPVVPGSTLTRVTPGCTGSSGAAEASGAAGSSDVLAAGPYPSRAARCRGARTSRAGR